MFVCVVLKLTNLHLHTDNKSQLNDTPVYGTLHMTDHLPLFEKSRVVIPVAGFT